MSEPVVVLESRLSGDSFAFLDLQREVCAHTVADVASALAQVEDAVAGGLHAAGFLSYEAAPGLDPALKTFPPGDLPLVWFGLYARREKMAADGHERREAYRLSEWQPSVFRADYDTAMNRIRDYIIAGDTYQVNYTFRMHAAFEGSAQTFYRALCRAQRTSFSAFLDLGRFQILSASPELFFSLKDGVLTARPMKGTAPRGRWTDEDEARAEALHKSEKDRAENVMIVDLLRNDLGRVSKPGSVRVGRLWDVERYETVLQMTSTITSRIRPDVGFVDLMRALFPCGSVTGAPKVRTMEIIEEVEDRPRGIYTGSIGYVSPGGEACFNVAIRTVCIDRNTGWAEFGVGGGVTFDSSSDGEYEECATKAQLLMAHRPDFDLFETLRYDADGGYFLLDRHLNRLAQSAAFLGFEFDRKAVVRALKDAERTFDLGAHRVRLVLRRGGAISVESTSLGARLANGSCRVDIARSPVNSQDALLFHKTTRRDVYASRLAEKPDCDDVIMVNELGEVTECTIGNLVAELDGQKVTPPVRCGLLPGTFRDALIDEGTLKERPLTEADLRRASALYMINSVREWVRLTLIDQQEARGVPNRTA